MNPWVYIIGVMVSANCLLAFSSNGVGSRNLALWLGFSFAGSIAIETCRFIPPPYMMVVLATLDLFMTGMCLGQAAKHKDIAWTLAPIGLINLGFIVLHLWAIASQSEFITYKRLYLGALDGMFMLQLAINGSASMRNGVHLSRLFPARPDYSVHRVKVGISGR